MDSIYIKITEKNRNILSGHKKINFEEERKKECVRKINAKLSGEEDYAKFSSTKY